MKLYLIPNLFTTGNLFFGFYSIVNTVNGDFEKAVWSLLIAMIMDILDGKVARLTKSTSDFGVEYDSLADLVSFGVAPSVFVLLWQLIAFGKMGLAVAFMLTASTAIRLARFNILANKGLTKDFVGLPSPASCGLIASFYLFAETYLKNQTMVPYLVLILTFISSLLMVSGFKYKSFKSTGSDVHFKVLIVSVLVIVAIISNPHLMLFIMFFGYLLSAPITKLITLFRLKQKEEEKVGL